MATRKHISSKGAVTPKLPEFEPVFTDEQVRQMEADYNESWGEKRRLVMIALTRTPAQLVEGFTHLSGDAFEELLAHMDDFKSHCMAGVEVAEAAKARMLAVGMYIANKHEEGASA